MVINVLLLVNPSVAAYITEAVVLTVGTHSNFMHIINYEWATFNVTLCRIIMILEARISDVVSLSDVHAFKHGFIQDQMFASQNMLGLQIH